MKVMSDMVDMAKTPEELEERATPPGAALDQPIYPYGLSICLCKDEIEKLGLEDEMEVGDMVHLHCLAKVTGVSKNETTSGSNLRVELQITHIAAEGEDEENEEAEEEIDNYQQKVRPHSFYKR